MPYSAGRMLASKIAYSAQNSAGRIYPSLAAGFSLYKLVCNGWMHCIYFLQAEEGMEIEDKVAFACKYLPDNKVHALSYDEKRS